VIEVRLKVVEQSVPIAAIPVQPLVEFAERLCPEFIEPSLCVDRRHHEARVSQHSEMLRDLRLLEIETLLDLADMFWSGPEKLNDSKSVGFCQCREGRKHEVICSFQYMLVKAYVGLVAKFLSASPRAGHL